MPEATTRLVLLHHANRQARAAWFEPTHRSALTKAAAHADFALVELEPAQLKAIAPDMPAGKIGANGTPEQLPLILAGPFQRLLTLAQSGGLVKPPPAGPGPGATAPVKSSVAPPWAHITVGSTVLASDAKDDGWWECIVLGIEPNGMLQLRWRDFPDYPYFKRPISNVGLLSPSGMR